jgi:chemotaxis protein MotB
MALARGAAPTAGSTTGRASSTPCRRCCSPSCSCSRCSCWRSSCSARDLRQGRGAEPPQLADQRADPAAGAGALEHAGRAGSAANLQASLEAAETERSRLEQLLSRGAGADAEATAKIGALSGELDSEREVSQRALSQVELLNQQIAALRKQIGALEAALDVSEQRDRESNTKIADLGRRLNVALAQRVQELNRYRSDFFGRLREILSDRENIRIVGDRFVFQSEVLFPSGSEVINEAGRDEMKKLADAIIELQREIPPEINWVLRVDGHTDNKPLSGTGRYRDNWELSSARSTSVVKYLIENGVPANRLVAAGFGEFQPLDPGDTDEARSKNRRIELKLTER